MNAPAKNFRSKLIFAVFVFSSFCGWKAAASDCSSVDVRRLLSPALKPLFAIPRNQGMYGLCFADVAADLLSFRFNTPISGFELGIAHSASVSGVGSFFRQAIGQTEGGINNGGNVADAISIAQNRGFLCREDDIPTQDKTDVDEVKILQMIQSRQLAIDDATLKDDPRAAYNFGIIRAKYPKLSVDQVREVINQKIAGSVSEIFQALDAKACRANPISFRQALRVNEIDSNSRRSSDLISAIDMVLNSGRPLAMEYRKNMFLNPDRTGGFVGQIEDDHVSTIIGRGSVGGQCMYLIRNSWGFNQCSGFKSGTHCNDLDGTFMISADDLRAAAMRVEYIEN
jgi:hypothetical protein